MGRDVMGRGAPNRDGISGAAGAGGTWATACVTNAIKSAMLSAQQHVGGTRRTRRLLVMDRERFMKHADEERTARGPALSMQSASANDKRIGLGVHVQDPFIHLADHFRSRIDQTHEVRRLGPAPHPDRQAVDTALAQVHGRDSVFGIA